MQYFTGYASDADLIRDHAEKIIASGVLGRSKVNQRLFNYLVDRSVSGSIPKELEIAIDVFDKDLDFDVGHDSIVRVYMHKLRQKLDEFYLNHHIDDINRIVLPRGQYKLAVAPARDKNSAISETAVQESDKDRRGGYPWLVPLLVISLMINGLLLLRTPGEKTPLEVNLASVSEHPVWSGILDDDIPVTIVLGDYYIFAEMDEASNVNRLIRDFSINSGKDLEELLLEKPDLSMKFLDVDLNYLPVSSAYALSEILPVLNNSGKHIDIRLMSEFNAAELKSGHIIYVGYISAMDKFSEFVFASSGLAVAGTYDELINLETGETYYSEAGILPFDNTNYRDYGFFSMFPGPAGNRIMAISGTRDEGLMQTAQVITSHSHLQFLSKALSGQDGMGRHAFEALFEVTGMDRTSLDAMLIYTSPLDYQTIWGGELPDAEGDGGSKM